MTMNPNRKTTIYDKEASPDMERRRHIEALIGLGVFGPAMFQSATVLARSNEMLIDGFSSANLVSEIGTQWRGVSDQVMGGVSKALIMRTEDENHHGLHLSGDVRLENNGGFIQASLDLAPEGGTLDASSFTGIRLSVRGNAEVYSVHLRTTANTRPWQSYRAHFTAGKQWQTIDLPFETFAPHRLEIPLDVTQLRRIGLVAIGREFYADLKVSRLSFYQIA